MCEFYDPNVPKQCREDDAEEVFDKEKSNFCEWFKPGSVIFDATRASQEAQSKDEFESLFGERESSKSGEDAVASEADKLFK